MKRLWGALFLLCLGMACAGAFSVQADKNTVQKGESVVFSGTCTANQGIEVKAIRNTLTIFENSFTCPNTGEWSVPQEIGFLDPSGDWNIVFSGENQQKTVFLFVAPSRESSLLVLTFLNEPDQPIKRLEKWIFTIRALEAGKPAQNTQVFFWNLNGKRVSLQAIGEGLFRGSLEVPVSMPIQEFDFVIVAQKTVEGTRLGGEISSKITIAPAPIRISILKPKQFSLETGKPSEWEIKATYWDESPLEQETVTMKVGKEKEFTLSQQQNGNYSGSFIPLDSEAQSEKVRITATDAFGNSGSLEKPVVISHGFFFGVYTVFFWGLLALILLVGFIKVIYPNIRHVTGLLNKPQAESKVRLKIKKLQTQYYTEQSISRNEYKEKMEQLQKEFDELKTK